MARNLSQFGRFRIGSLKRELGEVSEDLRTFIRIRGNAADVCFVAFRSSYNQQTFTTAIWYDLYEQFIKSFRPVQAGSRVGYLLYGRRSKALLSLEPYAYAPPIVFDRRQRVAVVLSDPWHKLWMAAHLSRITQSSLWTPYPRQTNELLMHLGIEMRVVEFLWFYPDSELAISRASFGGFDIDLCRVALPGSLDHPAYSMRLALKGSARVANHDALMGWQHHGRNLFRSSYFDYLRSYGCAVSAMDFEKRFDVVFAKSVEIAGSGRLLIQQESPDLTRYGFEDGVNCVVFASLVEFEERLSELEECGCDPWELALGGLEVVADRHLTSHRIRQLADFFEGERVQEHPVGQ